MRSTLFVAPLLLVACGENPTPPASTPSSASTTPSPLVVVTDKGVALDGTPILDGDAADKQGTVVHLRDLSARLEQRHGNEQWFDAKASASTNSAMSAINSAATSGYSKVHLKTKSGWLDAKYFIPTTQPEEEIHARVVAQLDGDGILISWQSDRPCDAVPEDVRVKPAELSSYLDKICANAATPCVDNALVILFGSPVTFTDGISALESIRPHAGAAFTFTFGTGLGVTKSQRSCAKALRFGNNIGLAPARVRNVVLAATPALQKCAGDQKGIVVAQWRITPDGKVENAAIVDSMPVGSHGATTLHDPTVLTCVLDVVQGLSFPKSAGSAPTIISAFPFKF